MVFPQWRDVSDVEPAALDVMAVAGGAALSAFFTTAYVAGCFGSAMASPASASRILYWMGRDGALPRTFLGRLHERYRTPVPAMSWVAAGFIYLLGLTRMFTRRPPELQLHEPEPEARAPSS